MRSVFVIVAIASVISVPLCLAARADEPSLDKPQTSLKRIYVPDQKMLQRDPGIGDANRGKRNQSDPLVHPAPAGGSSTAQAPGLSRD
jgi:hypothetical protein